jgi:hypothetical protein
MMTRARWRVWAVPVVTLAALAGTAAAASTARPVPLATARAFVQRLEVSGRAEADFERIVRFEDEAAPDPVRGRLVLEVPDRALIEFPPTGERITLRPDGGEWLQPRLGQLLTLEASHAATARRWWSMLTGADPQAFGERRLAGRRWLVWTVEPDAESDTARVTLDPAGLPASIRVRESSGLDAEYRFRSWKFTRPRGERAFHIVPEPGMRVVPMP